MKTFGNRVIWTKQTFADPLKQPVIAVVTDRVWFGSCRPLDRSQRVVRRAVRGRLFEDR